MRLVTYRAEWKQSGKEKIKQMGDTALGIYFYYSSNFWNHVNVSCTKNKSDQLGWRGKLRLWIELNCISNDQHNYTVERGKNVGERKIIQVTFEHSY